MTMDIRECIIVNENATGSLRLGGTYPDEDDEIVSLATLQFGSGGLFDAKPVDDYKVHLVREKACGGTPGPTLCGIQRFHPEGAGWSVRGGITPRGHAFTPCDGCAEVRAARFPTFEIHGLGKEAHVSV